MEEWEEPETTEKSSLQPVGSKDANRAMFALFGGSSSSSPTDTLNGGIGDIEDVGLEDEYSKVYNVVETLKPLSLSASAVLTTNYRHPRTVGGGSTTMKGVFPSSFHKENVPPPSST